MTDPDKQDVELNGFSTVAPTSLCTTKKGGEDGSVEDGTTQVTSGGPSLKEIKFKLWKNCIVLSVAWLCLYMGYNSISAIQSSLNSQQGLGVVTMCVEFATMTFGNLFTDSIIIGRLGCKWSVALGMAVYSVYMAANFYPTWYTLVPLAAVSGICSAAMWVAQSAYLTRLGQEYADRVGINADDTKSRFLGILYMFYLGSNVIGNAVSSLILGSNLTVDPLNDPNYSNPYQSICGAVYCNEDLGTSFNPSQTVSEESSRPASIWLNGTLFPEGAGAAAPGRTNSRAPGVQQVYAFCAFCVIAGVLAAITVTIFLDSLPSLKIDETSAIGQQSAFKLFTASIRQWKNPNQLLLIPIGIYNGMDNPFWSAEFTKAFVTCAIGMHFIGYVMVCYGITAPVSAFVFSWLGKRRCRLLPFFVAYLAHICTAISLLYWHPEPSKAISMFLLTGAWGIGTGVWSSQVPVFYSIIFPDNLEAAFSNSRLWDAAGRTMSYAWSYPLCMKYKIYLIMTMVSLGIIGLIGIDVKQWYFERRKKAKRASELIENGVECNGSTK